MSGDHEYTYGVFFEVDKQRVEWWIPKDNFPKLVEAVSREHKARRLLKIDRIMMVDLSLNNVCVDNDPTLLERKLRSKRICGRSSIVKSDSVKSVKVKSDRCKSDRHKSRKSKGSSSKSGSEKCDRKRKKSQHKSLSSKVRSTKVDLTPLTTDFASQQGQMSPTTEDSMEQRGSGNANSHTNASNMCLTPYIHDGDQSILSWGSRIESHANVNITYSPTYYTYNFNLPQREHINLQFHQDGSYANDRNSFAGRNMSVERFRNGRIMRTKGCDSWKPSKDLL